MATITKARGREIAKQTGMSLSTVMARSHRGWSEEEIIKTPVLPKGATTKRNGGKGWRADRNACLFNPTIPH